MILRPSDLAERWEVSLATIYRMVRDREGPPLFRLSGKLIRFRKADVEAWEARQCALLDAEQLEADMSGASSGRKPASGGDVDGGGGGAD